MAPLAAYQHAVAHGGFHADDAQWQAAQLLQNCHDALDQDGHQGLPKKSARTPVTGVYLWGPVGRGKTWLLDRFYQSLRVPARRQHFHHFMRWVHQRLFALSGCADPLQSLARELRADCRVLCFDELFISDIGDAMLLGGLLQNLFAEGVVVVATSNQAPEQLYAGGFNRERLLPAIAAINKHMRICAVDGGQDHRLHPGTAEQRYWQRSAGQPSVFPELFTRLSGDAPIQRTSIILGQCALSVMSRSEGIIWFRYLDLLEQPLSALDFIALAEQCSILLLGDVPALNGAQKANYIARGTEDGATRVLAGERQLPQLTVNDDSVRRFIALVDECYERRIPIYIEAQVPLAELYTEGYLIQPFQRALSRLQEMQLQRY